MGDIMAVSVHNSSYTIRGIKYNVGSSFKCYASHGGTVDSEGGGGSAADLTKGSTYYYLGYATDDDKDDALTSYPFKVGTSSTAVRGWYKENVFPYATYTIAYNKGTYGSGTNTTVTKTYGTAKELKGAIFTRKGYTQSAWASNASGTIKAYNLSASYTSNSDDTLYPYWTANTYTIKYDKNGGSGTTSSSTHTYGTSKKLTANGFSRTGYTFLGWSQSSSATSATYTDNQSVLNLSSTNNDTITLYAVWKEHVLIVNYYSNYADYCTLKGKSVSVSSSSNVRVHTSTHLYSDAQSNGLEDIQNESNLYMTRTGYTTTSKWGTSVDGGTLVGEKTSFNTGQLMAVALGKSLESGDASVDVYPQWKPNGIIYIDNGTSLVKYLVYIDNGSSWDIYLPYVDNGTSWDRLS